MGKIRFASLFFLPILILLLVKVCIPLGSQLRSLYFPHAATTPKPINVLEIRYYPHDPVGQDAKTQILSDGLLTAMSDASIPHGYKDGQATRYASVVLKRTIERDRNSPNTTGSYATYYHSMDTMLTADGEDLCQYIVDNDIDQVWFWKNVGDGTADTGGFNLEYYRVWSNTLFPVQSPPALCGGRRSFLVLGLDQDRAVGEALHSFGHSSESLLASSQGTDLFWNRFAGASHQICGNVHFPPNAPADYDYSIASISATTSCEDWNPEGTGATTSVTCTRWSCDEVEYLKWWFQNMPNDGNAFTYGGKTLPNWWSFQSDTDTALIQATNADQYISPFFADAYRPNFIDSVAGSTQESGTLLTFSQTISGANRLFILGSSYRSPSKSSTVSGNEQITEVTIGGVPLTRVNRSIFHEYVTELWYLVAPPVGTQTITVTYASGVQDEVVGGTSFIGVDQSTPFDTNTGYAAGTSANASNPTITIASNTSQQLFGVVSMYTGSSNDLGVSGTTHGVWGMLTTNVIGKAGLSVGGASGTLSWDSLASWPWSMSALAINFIQATPTPEPTSSAGPSCNSQCSSNDHCPSDLICASGFCRKPGCTALDTCTCGASCNSSCTQNSDCPSDLICASGACRKPGCTALDSCDCGPQASPTVIPASFPLSKKPNSKKTVSTRSSKPTVNLKANGYDALNVYPPKSIKLSWTSSNVRTCVASGAWYGQTLVAGSMITPPIFTSTQYKIDCTGPLGTVSDSVNLTSVNPK